MVCIVDYGVGNIQSVVNAFKYIGVDAVVTYNKNKILDSSHIVLPGVGAFQKGMADLEKHELVDVIKQCANSGRYLLGICLGMQLLLSTGYEGGVFKGLDIIKGEVVPFNVNLKVPQIGWNDIQFSQNMIFNGLNSGEYFYFVHGYYAKVKNESNILCKTEYGVKYASGVTNGENVFGFQFHPEKSGDMGLKILSNFGGLK